MHNLTILPIRRLTLVFALCIFLAGALTSHARDIIVDDDCNLRDAIEAANENNEDGGCSAGGGPSDTIKLTRNVRQWGPLPEIESDILIIGNGHRVTFSDYTAFVVDDASLILANLHIRFDSLRTERLLEITDGKLTLDNTVFHDCTGVMRAEDSGIELRNNSVVCGHPQHVIKGWFGVYAPPLPPPPTCEALTGATVTLRPGSAAECQNVDAVGLGNQSLVDAGFIDAVDIWSYLGPGVDICFPQIGSLVFLDAATAPRALSTMQSYSSGGMTCAFVDRPGTVVLMPGQPSGAAPPAAVEAPAPATVSDPAVEGCPIRTTGHINFRAEPSLDAERLGVILRGSTVGAISRIWGWYQINFRGRTGWIGGKYVDNIGNC
ncbi:MAG: SH3 domain-containing protein [Chloroflexota bacterium]|nr:SH3 domain-containing protein [Chloroflexota bacterium]